MLGFVGFAAQGGLNQQADWWSMPSNQGDPFPEASVIAVLLDDPFKDTVVANQIRVELGKAFQQGTRVLVCGGDRVGEGLASGVSSWLQARLGVDLRQGGPWDIRPATPELAPYFSEHLAHFHVGWRSDAPSDVQFLAELQSSPGLLASVRFGHENSDVVLLPVGRRDKAREAVRRFLELLPPREPYPEYLDELDVTGDPSLKAEIKRLQEELAGSIARLEEGRALKRIMYFTDHDLEVEAVRFLDEELSISARHMPGVDEDGWLVNDDGQDWAIIEVKGMGKKSVAKGDAALLMSHRQNADKADDFPALLVANTFHRAGSLEERDRPVEREVLRFAAGQHILIVRTLDLLRLKKLAIKDQAAVEALAAAIREGGGWFEVDAQDQPSVHEGR